jgi:hypothetical protein
LNLKFRIQGQCGCREERERLEARKREREPLANGHLWVGIRLHQRPMSK